MMYMPDALKAAIDVMEADPDGLVHRNATFNVTGMNFTPEGKLTEAIRRHVPGSRSPTRSTRCAERSPTRGRTRSTTRPRGQVGLGPAVRQPWRR
ncbi:MAG: hypothetical protein R2991_12310 [Thermoanaerobaculia bacterium]